MKRVMDEEGLSARQAEHRIRESDREVQARVSKMLEVDVEEPQLYDAVLNTTSAPLEFRIPRKPREDRRAALRRLDHHSASGLLAPDEPREHRREINHRAVPVEIRRPA